MAGYSAQEVAAMLGLPPARLRAYVRSGLLSEEQGEHGRRRFSFQDLLLLRTAEGLVAERIPPRRVVQALKKLREHLDRDAATEGESAGTVPVRPLTGVPLSTDGDRIVAHEGRARWQPESGQMLLVFPDASPAIADTGAHADADGPIPLSARRGQASAGSPAGVGEVSADDLYRIAGTLEETDPVHAVHTYRQALALDPGHADAHVNLGRLLHVAGERGRAEPHYREAVKLDPDDPTPHFNLGVLLEEQGRRDEAVHAYRQAILRDPDFADAHCNLGLLLESFGRVEAVGESFQVYKIGDIDVSLPRRDSKAGRGHRGFVVTGDPDMSIAEAARRRDFTVNAISWDPLTGEYFDPFDGRRDLERRVLRVVDPDTFGDDSLRVLRGVQFMARFGLTIEASTAALCRQIPLDDLPAERVWGEFEKLLFAPQPSLGFALALELGVIAKLFPELQALAGCPQEPK